MNKKSFFSILLSFGSFLLLSFSANAGSLESENGSCLIDKSTMFILEAPPSATLVKQMEGVAAMMLLLRNLMLTVLFYG